MNRGQKRWTVDWTGNGEPSVGDVVRHVTAVTKRCSYWRVTGVRIVRHVKPLPEGYVARYKVTVEHVEVKRTVLPVSWTLKAWKPKPRTHDVDRFSPLI